MYSEYELYFHFAKDNDITYKIQSEYQQTQSFVGILITCAIAIIMYNHYYVMIVIDLCLIASDVAVVSA